MGFAIWMDEEVVWAQGTHEYRPLGVAVIAASDLFTEGSFSRERPAPLRTQENFAGLFASLGDVNAWLERRRSRSQVDKKNRRPGPSYAPPYL